MIFILIKFTKTTLDIVYTTEGSGYW